MPVVIRAMTRLQDGDDVNVTLGPAKDGYSVTYDDGTGKFVLTSVSGGGGTPGGSDTQVQFNDSSAFGGDAGFTYNKTTDVATLVGGLVAPKVYPASDSTTAFQINKADGTTNVFNVDTTNGRVGIGTTAPTEVLDLEVPSTGGIRLRDVGGNILYIRGNLGGGHPGISSASGHFGFYGTKINGDGTNSVFIVRRSLSATRIQEWQDFDGTTRGVFESSGNVGIGQSSSTALLDVAASTTARSSIRIRSGTAPTSPNEGDLWYDGTNLMFRDSSTTRTITWT